MKDTYEESVQERLAFIFIRAADTGRVLTQNRACDLKWGVPGGWAEPWEDDPEATVRREALEETGHELPDGMVQIEQGSDSKGRLCTIFYVLVDREFNPTQDHETLEFRWVDQNDWPENAHSSIMDQLRMLPDQRLARARQRDCAADTPPASCVLVG